MTVVHFFIHNKEKILASGIKKGGTPGSAFIDMIRFSFRAAFSADKGLISGAYFVTAWYWMEVTALSAKMNCSTEFPRVNLIIFSV